MLDLIAISILALFLSIRDSQAILDQPFILTHHAFSHHWPYLCYLLYQVFT